MDNEFERRNQTPAEGTPAFSGFEEAPQPPKAPDFLGFDDAPVTQPAPEPVFQPAPEPVFQPAPEPVFQPAPEPVPQPQPAAAPHQAQKPLIEPFVPGQPYYGAQPQQAAPQYDPAPSQYHWRNPNLPPQEPEKAEKPRKKGKGVWKKILAAVLAVIIALGCALAGGVVGAVIVEKNMEDKQGNGMDNFPLRPELPEDQTNVLEGERDNTVIDINKIDTSKQMTPAEVYALNVNSTVGITTSITTNYWGYTTTSAAAGSGFVYSDDGYIITNYHVIEDSNSITVSLYDGSTLDAKLIGFDESNDVAVLKVDAEDLTPVIIGDSANLNVGDPVLAIGNPLGELTFSLTSGTVSALDREVTFSGGVTMNLIQTDCAINSGNSGGALFNLYGEVIGVTNAKYSGNSSSGASIDNIGFAIPMNHVRTIVDSIIENGFVVKPYIGVTIVDVSEESIGYGLPEGASIQGVVEGSPAEAAGLQISDIVTHIDGERITGSSELKKKISGSKPGDQLKLTVYRKGETLELTLTVGQQTSTTTQQPQQQEPQQGGQFPFDQFPDFFFPGFGF